MTRSPLGRTGLEVSRLAFGASALGGVFGAIHEDEGVRAVHAALGCGIKYFDVAPAYGGTRAETVLGRALRGIRRDRYVISTKVGKYTAQGAYGADTFDYGRARIRASIEESLGRLGCDRLDIVHLHDIEYQGRRLAGWALGEGLEALHELKREGRIGAVGVGIYPIDLCLRVLADCEIDVALVHNHYCLNDTRLLEVLPIAGERGVGIVNGAPFASGLLTEAGPPDWHPADATVRAVFREAAGFCRAHGTRLTRLAIQFASQHPGIATTLFSAAGAQEVEDNARWHAEPYDPALVAAVRSVLEPVRDIQWRY